MAILAQELIAKVRADVSDFESGMRRAQSGMTSFARGVEDAVKPAADAFASLGRALTQGFGMGIGLQAFNDFSQALERAVGGAVGFQQELIRIQNNTTMTAADVALMRDGILKLGAETGASF